MEGYVCVPRIVSGPMAGVAGKRQGTVAYLQVLEMHGRLGPTAAQAAGAQQFDRDPSGRAALARDLDDR